MLQAVWNFRYAKIVQSVGNYVLYAKGLGYSQQDDEDKLYTQTQIFIMR